MKLTNNEVLNMVDKLNSFADVKLPVKITHTILRNLDVLKEGHTLCTTEFAKLHKQYLVFNEDGTLAFDEQKNIILKNKEELSNFLKDSDELSKCESDFNINTLSENDLYFEDPNDRYDVLTPRQISILISCLVFDSEKGTGEKCKND